MTMYASLSGTFTKFGTEIETEVHALFEKFSQDLARLGVTHSGSLSTPTLGGKTVAFSGETAAACADVMAADAPVAGGEAGTDAGGTATVSGTDLKTGDGVHTDTAGSPPKGPK